MQSLQVRVNNTPLVIGGNLNGRLKYWLNHLGIKDFHHIAWKVISINPDDMQTSADTVKREYGHYTYIFTVGTFADRILKKASIDHGPLPATAVDDKVVINHAMQVCRNYLMRNMYHAQTINPTLGS